MFSTGKTFLEYIFLLHGPPAVFRNKIGGKKLLLLHLISRFLLERKVITLPPRGNDLNALSLLKNERIHLQTAVRRSALTTLHT